MKGTEKQIKWAEDIKTGAMNTINANIERMSKDPASALEVRVLKILRVVAKRVFDSIDDAAKIIDRRNYLDGQAMIDMMYRYTNLIRQGKMSIDELAEKNGVTEY